MALNLLKRLSFVPFKTFNIYCERFNSKIGCVLKEIDKVVYYYKDKINRIYDGVEAEIRKSQAGFQII